MTENDIKKIIQKHLKNMTIEIQHSTAGYIDSYPEVVANVYTDKLYEAFEPFILFQNKEFNKKLIKHIINNSFVC